MNTTYLLLAEFQRADVPVEQVAERYLGRDAPRAKRSAAAGKLPFPAYRAGGQKSPWLVRITDLAEYLDARHREAAEEHRKLNS